eukprot:765353-Hanusia_phi.AAC.5
MSDYSSSLHHLPLSYPPLSTPRARARALPPCWDSSLKHFVNFEPSPPGRVRAVRLRHILGRVAAVFKLSEFGWAGRGPAADGATVTLRII